MVSVCLQVAGQTQVSPFQFLPGLVPAANVFVLRLPSVSLLNGSVVTDSEREDAERFFIRFYVDQSEEELPYRSTL